MRNFLTDSLRMAAMLLVVTSLLVAPGLSVAQSDTVGTSIAVTHTCTDLQPSTIQVLSLSGGRFNFGSRDPDDGTDVRIANENVDGTRVIVNANDCVTGWSVTATATTLVSADGNTLVAANHLRINRYIRTAFSCPGTANAWCRGNGDIDPVNLDLGRLNAPDTLATVYTGTAQRFDNVDGVATREMGSGTNTNNVHFHFRLRLATLTPSLPAGTYTGPITFTLTTVEP